VSSHPLGFSSKEHLHRNRHRHRGSQDIHRLSRMALSFPSVLQSHSGRFRYLRSIEEEEKEEDGFENEMGSERTAHRDTVLIYTIQIQYKVRTSHGPSRRNFLDCVAYLQYGTTNPNATSRDENAAISAASKRRSTVAT